MTSDVILLEDANMVAKVMERLANDPHNCIIMIGCHQSILSRDVLGLGDIHAGMIDLRVITPKSTAPEYGHYRVNFRTGKPLRY